MNGNSLEQITAVVSPQLGSLTVKCKVTMLSQPATLVNVWVAVPVAFKVCSYQMNGNSLEQIMAVVSPQLGSLIVKFRITVLSQPVTLAPPNTTVSFADCVYVLRASCHTYIGWPGRALYGRQTVVSTTVMISGLTVRFNVTIILSQPVIALCKVSLQTFVSEQIILFAFHWNVSP